MSENTFHRLITKRSALYVPNEVVEQLRAKAIDDFVNACKEDILCQTFGLHINGIERIAEQLKEQK